MYSTVYLAAEDEPGLAIGRRLVASAPPLTVYREENAHGYGGLRAKVQNFQSMGEHGLPVLLLTDLDHHACPSLVINDWLGRQPSPGFLFRVCVREIESWVLADREAIACFLGIPERKIPDSPDHLVDPKRTLIELSQASKNRAIREGFKPTGTATIGPEYNPLLTTFINDNWRLDTAAASSRSLDRARNRLLNLATQVEV